MKKINLIIILFLMLALAAVFYRSYFSGSAPYPVVDDEFKNFNNEQKFALIDSTAPGNPALAWAYLKEGFIVNGEVVGNVHDYAHTIGNKAYEKFGINGIKICDPAFAFGCFHGVTEAMILEEGMKSVKSVELKCLKLFPLDESQNYASCIHGSGHGLYEFEHRNLKKALVDCDIMSESYRQYCYDGVFMERSFTSSGKTFDAQNPWKFCTDLDERYHRNCARYQSQIFIENSLTSAGKNCALGSSALLRETCFESLGYYIAQNTLGVPAEILKSCKQMPSEEGRDICIRGGAVETTFQHYGNFKASADKLCKSLGDAKQSECLNIIQNMIVQLPKNDSAYAVEISSIKATSDLKQQIQLYTQLIERVGPVEAQEDLFRSGLPFTGETHLLNHTVGDYLYEKFGPAGLVQCKEYFLSSCHHGFILHAIADGGMSKVAETFAECRKYGPAVFSQCAHAMGHGFLANVGYKNLIKALKTCDTAAATMPEFPAFNCYDGVFMENIWAVHDGAPSPDRWVKPSDIQYPCNDKRIDEKYLLGCWSNQPSLAYQYFSATPSGQDSIKQVAEKLCAKVKKAEWEQMCFDGLARQIHPLTEGKASKTFELCNLMPDEKWNNFCVSVNAGASYSVGDRNVPFEICANISESGKTDCYNRIFGALRAYKKPGENLKSLCAKITEPDWRERCEQNFF